MGEKTWTQFILWWFLFSIIIAAILAGLITAYASVLGLTQADLLPEKISWMKDISFLKD